MLQLLSLEWGGRVAVSLEGTVDNIGSSIDKVWHNWLILRAVPWNISWLSNPVSVAGLVVLMEDWSLSGSPLSVSIWNRWVLWQDPGEVPPEEVWVVHESSSVELVVVHDDRSLVSKTSAETLGDEEHQVEVGEPASDVEVLDWELSDDGQTDKDSKLASGGVVGPVPVGLGDWSNDDVLSLALWEPGAENVKIFLGLVGPAWEPLLHGVLGETEADKIVVLNVLGGLEVGHSSHSVIEGVL